MSVSCCCWTKPDGLMLLLLPLVCVDRAMLAASEMTINASDTKLLTARYTADDRKSKYSRPSKHMICFAGK